jgi:hypothetical protein
MSKDVNIEDVNRLLVENGIYVNHLQVKKQSLEEEFLQITSNPLP